jgi:hypothetical protein
MNKKNLFLFVFVTLFFVSISLSFVSAIIGACPNGCSCYNSSRCQYTWHGCWPNNPGSACDSGYECKNGACVVSSVVPSCVPSCINKNCGDDGCGGTCGTCSDGYTCNSLGTCKSTSYDCSIQGCSNINLGKSFTCNKIYTKNTFSCNSFSCPSGYNYKGCSTVFLYLKKLTCEKNYDTGCSASPTCGTATKTAEISCGIKESQCQSDGNCVVNSNATIIWQRAITSDFKFVYYLSVPKTWNVTSVIGYVNWSNPQMLGAVAATGSGLKGEISYPLVLADKSLALSSLSFVNPGIKDKDLGLVYTYNKNDVSYNWIGFNRLIVIANEGGIDRSFVITANSSALTTGSQNITLKNSDVITSCNSFYNMGASSCSFLGNSATWTKIRVDDAEYQQEIINVFSTDIVNKQVFAGHCLELNNTIVTSWHTDCSSTLYNPVADITNNGIVDVYDLIAFADHVDNAEWCQSQLDKTINPCAKCLIPPGNVSFDYNNDDILNYTDLNLSFVKNQTNECYPEKVCDLDNNAIINDLDWSILAEYISSGCSSTEPILTGNVYWANMMDAPISYTNVSDTVKLVWITEETNLDNIEFTIKKSGELSWNPVNWFPHTKATIDGLIGTWNASELGTFTFTARNTVTNVESEVSNELVVTPEDNSPPTADITNPEHKSKHLVEEVIPFEQNASDVDDDLEITWNFDEGQPLTIHNCLTSDTGCNVNYNYSTSGTKTIELLAKEETREQSAYDLEVIYVYKEGINVFADINTLDPLYQSRLVPFDASTSYVANCSNCTDGEDSVCPTCLGIECYNVTGNVRINDNGDSIKKTLQCFDLPKTDIGTTIGKYNLWFNWTFSEGIPNERFGNWIDNRTTVVEFDQIFSSSGRHFVNLRVGYEQF